MLSLPLRECGLKFENLSLMGVKTPSLPLRECGLKFTLAGLGCCTYHVTPLAGVWIEIIDDHLNNASQLGHSPCGSVD